MDKPNSTGVRAGNPKNTSAGKLMPIKGPSIPLNSGKGQSKAHSNVVNS